MKLKARRLGLPFSLPPKPDPIRQNTFTGEVMKDQPYIFDICHFLQAIEHDRQLDFAYEISRCIFGGTKDWHKDENLIEVTSKLGLDFESIKNRTNEKKEELISQIKQIKLINLRLAIMEFLYQFTKASISLGKTNLTT